LNFDETRTSGETMRNDALERSGRLGSDVALLSTKSDDVARPSVAGGSVGVSHGALVVAPLAESGEEVAFGLSLAVATSTTTLGHVVAGSRNRGRGRNRGVEGSTSDGDLVSSSDVGRGSDSSDDSGVSGLVVEAASSVNQARFLIVRVHTADTSSDGRLVVGAVSDVVHLLVEVEGGSVGEGNGESLTDATTTLLEVDTSPFPTSTEGDSVGDSGAASRGQDAARVEGSDIEENELDFFLFASDWSFVISDPELTVVIEGTSEGVLTRNGSVEEEGGTDGAVFASGAQQVDRVMNEGFLGLQILELVVPVGLDAVTREIVPDFLVNLSGLVGGNSGSSSGFEGRSAADDEGRSVLNDSAKSTVDADFIFSDNIGEGGTIDGDESATTDGANVGCNTVDGGENEESVTARKLGATTSTVDEVEWEGTRTHGVDSAREGTRTDAFTEEFTTLFLTDVEGEVEVTDSNIALGEARTSDDDILRSGSNPLRSEGGNFGSSGSGVVEGAATRLLTVGKEAKGANGKRLLTVHAVDGSVGETDDASGSTLIGNGVTEDTVDALTDKDIVRTTSHIETGTKDSQASATEERTSGGHDISDNGSCSKRSSNCCCKSKKKKKNRRI
jgi:hypothetical protein